MSEKDHQPGRAAYSGEQQLCQRKTTNLAELLIVESNSYVRERLRTNSAEPRPL